jgi:uncharacterized membrane protein YtjA (UPF0391 family)
MPEIRATQASSPGMWLAHRGEEAIMLHWAFVFFVIAVIAAVLGLRGVAGLSAEIGWLFAVLAVILLVVGLFGNLVSGRPPTLR